MLYSCVARGKICRLKSRNHQLKSRFKSTHQVRLSQLSSHSVAKSSHNLQWSVSQG